MFHTEMVTEQIFSDWEKLSAWVESEEKSTSRISITGMLENGANFQEDRLFGSPDFRICSVS